MSTPYSLTKFDKCCFCIPLDVGAHILGICSILGLVSAAINMPLSLINLNMIGFAFALQGLLSFFAVIGYFCMLCKNDFERRLCFANCYLASGILGYLAFYVTTITIFNGDAPEVAMAFYVPLIGISFLLYFYFCLTSYANFTPPEKMFSAPMMTNGQSFT